MFREVGFRISECYYSMKLDLESYTRGSQNQKEGTHFRFGQRLVQIVRKNEVLGKITWEPVENGKTSMGIFVKQAHRGKGFGTALMAETLHHLKSNGVKSVELGVDGNNLPALKLYREFGFDVQSTHFYVMMPCCNIHVSELRHQQKSVRDKTLPLTNEPAYPSRAHLYSVPTAGFEYVCSYEEGMLFTRRKQKGTLCALPAEIEHFLEASEYKYIKVIRMREDSE